MHQQISACRLCGNAELTEILDLGMQIVDDVFPMTRTERLVTAPLKLVKCIGEPDVCGLLQLQNTEYVVNPLPAVPSVAVLRSRVEEQRVITMPLAALSSQRQPMGFLRRIRDVLDNRGVCVIRERYMPSLMHTNSYDSLSHEQLAYYAVKQIRWIADRVGLKIVNIELGGDQVQTASVALARRESSYEECATVDKVLDEEARKGLHTLHPYRTFSQRVAASISLLRMFLDRARQAGKSVHALGATRQANVILQCCRATRSDITQIGETDVQKVGAFTPGTLLPIVPEEEVLAAAPDFLLVLAWKLRDTLVSLPRLAGRNLLFPLPNLELVRTGSSR